MRDKMFIYLNHETSRAGFGCLKKSATNEFRNSELVDDISKSGQTILHWLRYWLDKGYNVTQIVVFTDRNEGGLQRIHEEVAYLNASRNEQLRIEITCLITPQEIMSILGKT